MINALRNKKISFNPEKDLKVIAERRISLQDIINAIMEDKIYLLGALRA